MKEEEIRSPEILAQYLKMVSEDINGFFSDRKAFIQRMCPGCGKGESQKEFQKCGFQYVSCRHCETLYVNPVPDLDRLKRFHFESPSSRFWIEKFFLPFVSARREKIFKPRAQKIKERFEKKSGWLVADVGAGFGIFLEELQKIWADSRLVAIEPDQELAGICRSKGFEVIEKPAEEIGPGSFEFDLMVVFEVLEHIFCPRTFIRSIFNLLKPGGFVFLTTLNGRGFDIRILWEKANAIHPPHHLNFLNPDSFSSLLEENGFEILETATPGKLDVDILEGAIKNGFNAGRWWEGFFQNAGPKARQELQEWISRNLLSSHMSVLAKKPILSRELKNE